MADNTLNLFPPECVVGVFRGFREGGMEFHADLALPYRTDFHNTPMHGQFLLVQLETPDEAVLGRITSLSSEGRLSGPSGEDFNIRAVREGRPVPEELREDYLKYRVNIRVLGVMRRQREGLVFVASHRRLPHVGSPVAFPSGGVLKEIAGHNLAGVDVGFFALGEYIYAKGDLRLEQQPWMQVREPNTIIKFPIQSLVSRRTFVFARAGFGKSNLNKLLFSHLYATTPTVEKRAGRHVPVGTIIFDPDGEYFWPDDKGRPGLCDVPALENQVVVFTARHAPSPFYQSFVAGNIKLDVRRLRPSDVISIALPPERQDQQNVRKLRGLDPHRWEQLVDLIHRNRNNADLKDVMDLVGLEERQDAEALAARANMTTIVAMLHDPSSQMLDMLLEALSAGKLCIVDVSQLRGGPSLILSGLILRRIFDRNQDEFTKAEPRSIPTIAVVEEAQSVLNDKAPAATPYIEWVKEGRKYDLGALLITQQPGSIPTEILSQGDNWFLFHMLSAADLQNVKKANAHFSEDLLSSLLNEPLPGQGVFWSSVGGRPYPVPLRVLSFEKTYTRRDHDYSMPAVETFASQLHDKYAATVRDALRHVPPPSDEPSEPPDDAADGAESRGEAPVNVLALFRDQALASVLADTDVKSKLQTEKGFPWGGLIAKLQDALPPTMDDGRNVAASLVKELLNRMFGPSLWETHKVGPKSTTYARRKR
jgi:uncharacterized protein